jgi:hypothetical protein
MPCTKSRIPVSICRRSVAKDASGGRVSTGRATSFAMNVSNTTEQSQAKRMGGSSRSFAASIIFAMIIIALKDWPLDDISKLERRIQSLQKRHGNDEG